jgi:16S rRNA C967 or C1407 C5-methylase (RsmB/RsmF family)
LIPLPPALLTSLENLPGFNKETFEAVHSSGQQVTSIRFNPSKPAVQGGSAPITIDHSPLTDDVSRLTTRVPWSSQGYYLPARPSFTFDPLFHAGVYYVQEASSMFLEQALKQTVDLAHPLRILDLCAAPGGKSTLLQSLISNESLLISNDVIKSRAAIKHH